MIYVVDNTMTSPYLFRPKSVRASLVVNALTKYIGGHGNALGGSITDTGAFDWSTLSEPLRSYKAANPQLWGITQLRKKGTARLGRNAGRRAGTSSRGRRRNPRPAHGARLRERAWRWRSSWRPQRRVRAVYYPGLPGHPQHALARELFRGYGALLAFELDPGLDCFDFLDRLQNVVLSSEPG